MAPQAICVSSSTFDALHALAAERGTTIGAIVDNLLREHRDKQFWEAFDAAYAVLQADPDAWAEELAERTLSGTAVMDGLHDDPYDDPRIPVFARPEEHE